MSHAAVHALDPRGDTNAQDQNLICKVSAMQQTHWQQLDDSDVKAAPSDGVQ